MRLRIGIITRQESDAETPRQAAFLLVLVCLYTSSCLQKNRQESRCLQADTTLHAPLQSQDTGAAALQFSWPRDDPHAVQPRHVEILLLRPAIRRPREAGTSRMASAKLLLLALAQQATTFQAGAAAESYNWPRKSESRSCRRRHRFGVGRERGLRRAKDEESPQTEKSEARRRTKTGRKRKGRS